MAMPRLALLLQLAATVGPPGAGGQAAGGEGAQAQPQGGPYAALERMDLRRVMMRVAGEAPLPPAEEEVMLEELEQWKWRVEMAAAGAAVLVTSSQCPHGLGLLPSTLAWRGGGRWRRWPGTFEHAAGSLSSSASSTWVPIHAERACEGQPGIRQLGREVMGLRDAEACQRVCAERSECGAVDYYRATQWCLLYDRPCAAPDKRHDGASSYALKVEAARDVLEEGDFTFLEAKRRCHELDGCGGFSYSGAWSDSGQHAGVPHRVYFSSAQVARPAAGAVKWHSYLRRDAPRANCNPEGKQFECPANAYACLGLSIDADETAIKQAYRALSKQLHPDKVKASSRTKDAVRQAEEAFRDISESHEALRDGQRRRQIDMKLRKERKQWEEQRASVQDLYIKEPLITSLEPESYPALIPHGREWLVHFFLPANDECKQMKIALGRAAGELGTGEEERGLSERREPASREYFRQGDIFRGVIREKSVALRGEGAGIAEGDLHVALVVLSDSRAKLFALGEEIELAVSTSRPDGRLQLKLEGKDRTFVGKFDRAHTEWLRGTIADAPRPDHEVASFAVRKDTWQALATAPPKARQKPRLFGAVNCGRFPDFCKRKGADPALPKRFPQVRMLFPEEVRFEIYRGRALGREVSAFARESSRATGEVLALNATTLAQLQGASPARWLLLLHREAGKASLDCSLCRSALPALRRTAPRLAAAGLGAGWVNCSAEFDACATLAEGVLPEAGAEWGQLRLVELGRRAGAPPPALASAAAAELAAPLMSLALWDQQLLVGEASQAALVAALEAAAAMAELLVSRGGAAGRDEL